MNLRKLLLVLSLVGLFVSCKSTKPSASNEGKFISVPCSGYEYETSSGIFRASQSAISTNLSTSREKSLLAAKRTLSSYISSTVKAVTDRYVQDREIGGKNEFSEKFEGLTREVINQKLSGVKKICEKVKQLNDGRYQTFTAVELNSNEVLPDLNNRINRDSKLRQDYDKQKFEKTFNEEMSKLENR